LIRAQETAGNALTSLEYATQAGNKLRALGEDTESLMYDAMSQDLDFRNRLIEIFGRPYDGTIGFGKAYPEGYEGPDTLLFAYLDKIKIDKIIPQKSSGVGNVIYFNKSADKLTGISNNSELVRLFNKTNGGNSARVTAFESINRATIDFHLGGQLADLSLPYNTASRYGFEALPGWGSRTSYGTLQTALHDMLSAEIELDIAIGTYVAYLGTYDQKLNNLQSFLNINAQKEKNNDAIVGVRAGFNTAMAAIDIGLNIAKIVKAVVGTTTSAVKEGTPTSIGFSNDLLSAIRGVSAAVKEGADTGWNCASRTCQYSLLARNQRRRVFDLACLLCRSPQVCLQVLLVSRRLLRPHWVSR
jgi:hypothetical protein